MFHADRRAKRQRQKELKCEIRIIVYQSEVNNMKKVQKKKKET